MRFGVSLSNRGALAEPATMIAIAQQADDLGFYSMAISDHIVIPKAMPSNYPYHPEGKFPWQDARNYYEPLATMFFLAGATKRIRLGTSVLILSYRNPVVVAKTLASADALSGGRLFLGIGTGWWEDEYRALGIPQNFHDRGARTDEYVRIYRTLWTEENPEFNGEYHQFSNIEFSPKPAQSGGIPILIGGHTKRALRRTAELGDAWHPIGLRPPAGLTPSELETKIAELGALCEARGRDPKSIDTVFRCPLQFAADRQGPMHGTPESILEDIAAYAEAGADEIIFDLPVPDANALKDALARVASDVVAKA